MIPAQLMLEHMVAVMVTIGVAALAGLPLARLLRIQLGFPAILLLGVAYWAVALYLFPFSGGLLPAMLLAAIAAVIPLRRAAGLVPAGPAGKARRLADHARSLLKPLAPGTPGERGWGEGAGRQAARRPAPLTPDPSPPGVPEGEGRKASVRSAHGVNWSTAILLLGCCSYATFLFTSYVPMGMDASMHTTSARLIAEQAGLPRSYAPFAPQLVFPAVNLGLPTVAAVAIRLGCNPTSAMLAAEHLTFTCFILATYLLLRLWTRGSNAAWLAVLAAWSSRGLQETLGWGGFPTVMSLALGLLAVRLLIDIQRRPSLLAAVPLGIVVASLPLVHGVSAAIWVYAIAPVAFVVGFVRSRQRRQGIAVLFAAAGIAVICLLAYRLVGYTALEESEIAWTRSWQAGYAPEGEGLTLFINSLSYVKTYAGSLLVWAGVLATGVLLLQRRWRTVTALATVAMLLAVVVANSRHWVLPFSMLLYPERAVYWATPLAAIAIALMLRTIPIRRRSLATGLIVGVLLIPSCLRHYQSFQRVAFHPEVSRDGWEALEWACEHLDGHADYVAAPYNSAGSYLPAVAGVATTGWHAHHFLHEEARAMARTRAVTHLFVPRTRQSQSLPSGEVLFQNDGAAIIRFSGASHAQSRQL